MKYVLCLAFLMLLPSLRAQDPYLEEFRQKWRNARAYTMECADAMPASKYVYKPTEEQMPFARQLIHMAGNMIWLSTAYLGAGEFGQDLDHPPMEKQEVMPLIEEAFDFTMAAIEKLPPQALSDTVSFFAGTMTKRQILTLLNDHVTHHRGQLIVYLRLNGIEPPRYRGW